MCIQCSAQWHARYKCWEMAREATLSQEHPTTAHSPEGWETAVPWTGRAGILGVVWPGPGEGWGMLVSCGQDPETLGAWGSLRLTVRASVCWGGESMHLPGGVQM